ncbi:UDP-glucuronic acid decarboxylase family protein [Streptomyces sp. MAR4 CNX-425]|uniref:UDP-glucuronic acid decarboxylase family protein n=1 Tax=Streptomyces sp. MAR4 CNX-425 TaxID=3406343 RepID=UPI003B506DCA
MTGAAGFIGSHLCERLLRLGALVVGIDNLSTGRTVNLTALVSSPRFELITHDVTLPYRLDGVVDYVLHLASPASPRDYAELPLMTLKTGALGTLHFLELADAKQARFVLASTSEVYGDPSEHPQRESYRGNVNPVGPRSVYDEAKRYAEALTASFRRDNGTDTAITRIFNTYGPRMRPRDGRAVPAFISQALAGLPLTVYGDGSQTRSLCYVADTVNGLLALAASDHPGPVNIGNTDEITMLDLARRIRDLCGSPSSIESGELPVDDPRRRCPDITLARSLLSWTPRVGLTEGLRRTIPWMASAGAGAGTTASG